ncbi:histidine phosphatase family protein [Pelomonas sp. SE-A7]|uniref:histidine phosphatase family protein n=1 Tax=Pelomonas sp. SE-A7 TaxID=3054953 RepID=UPI00259CF85B|nr:histidine phosphatase family protein [Pelomonas sp. SE-A7]MDM4766219.1 histidine phosphatase family protein [Pelomonas sp. SE-A7]
MGTLHLVRHGQASFGAADYDQLSPLGEQQCVRLGEHWKQRGQRFDAVLRGSLKRHAQSYAGIAQGLGGLPEPLVWPGLNEYDSEAVVRAIHPGPLPHPKTAEEVRQHFRLLREGLLAWMRAESRPEGMPGFAEFSAGVAGALGHVRAHHAGQQVLIVSSGGPISVAVSQVLAAPLESTIELNLRIRNSAVSEFVFTPKKHALLSFNSLAHLDGAPDMQTYA